MKKIFRSPYLLTSDSEHTVIEDAFFAVESGKILDLGPWKKRPRSRSFRIEELEQSLIMPGLFNLHTHLPMSLFRGIAEDVDLHTWLFEYIFPAEKEFVSPSFVRLGAQLSACELIRHGITYVADMYYHQDVASEVFDKAGIRAILAQSFFDNGGFDTNDLEESFQGIRRLKKKLDGHPRLQAAVGPHAPYTCSLDTLRASAHLAKELELPVLIHMAETKKELEDIKQQSGLSPVGLVRKSGLFEAPRLLAAHSIWLDDSDFSILRQPHVTAILNPHSNAKIGAGISPVRKLMANKVRFSLGTDSVASNNRLDIFSEMNLLAKLYHLTESDMTGLKTFQLLDACTRHAAEAVGKSHRLGSLEPGKDADFIILDLSKPHLQPITNIYNHLIYSAQGSDVDSVYVAGKCLMKNRKIRSLPEEKIIAEANREWKKIAKFLKSRQGTKLAASLS